MAGRAQAAVNAGHAYAAVKPYVLALGKAYHENRLSRWTRKKLEEHIDYLDQAWAWEQDQDAKTVAGTLDGELEAAFGFGLLHLVIEMEAYMKKRAEAAAFMRDNTSVVEAAFNAHAARLQREALR